MFRDKTVYFIPYTVWSRPASDVAGQLFFSVDFAKAVSSSIRHGRLIYDKKDQVLIDGNDLNGTYAYRMYSLIHREYTSWFLTLGEAKECASRLGWVNTEHQRAIIRC